MKRDKLNYFVVGCFVVVMGAAFFVLMLAVSGRSGPTDPYHVFYRNVAGIKFGTGVFYEGYRVGQVERLEPEMGEEGMRYRLELGVTSGWKIPVDSTASIAASGLISAVTIEIQGGDSDQFLAIGAEITGVEKVNMFAALNRAAGDFHELTQQGILPVLANLNARITEISEELVGFRRNDLSPFVSMLHQRFDGELINEAMSTLNQLNESARAVRGMLGGVNANRVGQFLLHIDEAAVNLNNLITRIESTRVQMNQVLAGLDEILVDNGENLSNTISGMDLTVAETRRALETVNQHLDTMLFHLEGSSRNMHEFTRAIRENPSRIIRGPAPSELDVEP